MTKSSYQKITIMKTKTVLLFLVIVFGTSFLILNAQQPDTVGDNKQFVYIL